MQPGEWPLTKLRAAATVILPTVAAVGINAVPSKRGHAVNGPERRRLTADPWKVSEVKGEVVEVHHVIGFQRN